MIEVLKQALEALEKNYKLINGEGTRFGLEGAMDGYYSGCFDVDGTNKETENSIASLRQAIAGLESQEPLAWMKPDVLCDRACMYLCTKGFTQFPECANVPPQLEQNFCPRCGKRTNDIHTCTPPKENT